ncbi:hypothetical protein HanXRQr2_Chr04g0175111 [Helianthus annuus]|uniref:Uncharacterized protein n=1 Tax=Helianthus annuus TaxID=4232 RepID=A0A9K3J8V9_HELAN|nr:hypothetical protein HanXRQr2_Chr04g0175111 [Helianthus annuus]
MVENIRARFLSSINYGLLPFFFFSTPQIIFVAAISCVLCSYGMLYLKELSLVYGKVA